MPAGAHTTTTRRSRISLFDFSSLWLAGSDNFLLISSAIFTFRSPGGFSCLTTSLMNRICLHLADMSSLPTLEISGRARRGRALVFSTSRRGHRDQIKNDIGATSHALSCASCHAFFTRAESLSPVLTQQTMLPTEANTIINNSKVKKEHQKPPYDGTSQ